MSTILKAAVQSDIDAATIATLSTDLAVLRVTGTRLGCNMTNLDTVALALADTTTGSESNIELAKRAKALPAPAVIGSPATEIGGIAFFSSFTPHDFTVNGARYLKTTFIETDTAKFDTNLFKMSLNTRHVGGPTFTNSNLLRSGVWKGIATNGTTVLALTSISVMDNTGNATTPYVARSTDAGSTFAFTSTITGFSTSYDTRGIIYALGVFIVFGDGGKCSKSATGLTSSWTVIDPVGISTPIQDMKFNGSTIIATGSSFIRRSVDATNWTTVGAGQVSAAARFVACSFDNPSLWAIAGGDQNEGISRSTDNGLTWTRANFPVSATGNCVFLTYGRGYFYVGYPAGVFRSADLLSWEKVNTSLPQSSNFFYDSAEDVFVGPNAEVTYDFSAIYRFAFSPAATGQAIVRVNNKYIVPFTSSDLFYILNINATTYAGSPTNIDTGSNSLARGFVRIS